MTEPVREYAHDDYTVGWICALPEPELVVARAMLDEEHPVLSAPDPNDTNSYLLGRIGPHNVVIACLPAEDTGKVSAAVVAKDMLRTFKAIRFGLMVGVGGGAPSYPQQPTEADEDGSDQDFQEEDNGNIRDIRLGDVVTSLQTKLSDAVVQYDFGKSIQGKNFVRTGTINKPPKIVLGAISQIQSRHAWEGNGISDQLSEFASKHRRNATRFQSPGPGKDRLFKSDIIHPEKKKSCKNCGGMLDVNLVQRNKRSNSEPVIHYGTIGSADQVMRDATLRDMWAEKEKIICFEMEAAGLMDSFPCLVIRGICDYADSHKNKEWQPYAAVTAAIYAKQLLLVISGQGLKTMSPIELAGDKISRQLREWRRTEEEERCLQSFRTSDYEKYKDLNFVRMPGTCSWCLDDERFVNWRKNFVSSLLWVTADPGCGKSTLSRSLVDENLLNSQSNGNTIVCYFFFRDTSDVQRSPAAAIAALLHQVFKSKFGESLIRYALPRFKSDGAKLSTNLSAMWAIIEDIEKDINSPQMVFVIDALDECERSEQGRFIESVERLEQQRRKSSKPVTLKILITSRPYWNIEKGFQDHYRGAPCIRIPGEDQSHSFRLDIDSVINAQVWGLGAQVASEKAREQLLRGLLGYKNRTYLWVHLVFKILETEPRIATDTVHDILSNLPDSVEEAYVKILNKSRNSEQARKLLYIIVGAREPLSVEDIGVALYVTSNSRTYQDLELPTGRQLEITLRDLCGLFISVVENRVYLIHQTAKEFLVKPPGTQLGAATDFWKHSLCMKEADLILLKSCLWLLSFDVFEKTPEQFDLTIDGTFNGPLRLYEKTPKANALREYLNNHLFLGYSGKYWTVHFRGIEAVDETMLDLAFSICDTRSTRSVLWPLIFLGDGLIGGEDFSDGLILLRDGPILALATTGIEELMAPLLALGVEVNGYNFQEHSPLSVAVRKGHYGIVKMLVKRGANVDLHWDGCTLLQIAREKGQHFFDALLRNV